MGNRGMNTRGNKKCIIVLGMHRSGTSAFSGVLGILGVNLGTDLLDARKENPKGFYENRKIIQLNEQLLEKLDSAADSVHALPEGWWDTKALNPLIAEATRLVKMEFGDTSILGMKDPRLCRLLPFWKRVFRELEIEPCFVIPLRNPLETAASLKKLRHGFPVERTLMLWVTHMFEAELYSREFPRVFVFFDDLINNPAKVVADISDALCIDFPRNFDSAKDEIGQFLDRSLKHHNTDAGDLEKYLMGMLHDLYGLLSGFAYKKDTSRDELLKIDGIRSNYFDLRGFFYHPGFDVEHVLRIAHLEAQLDKISNSICWKLFIIFRKIRDRLLPQGSKRRKMVKNIRDLFWAINRQNISKSVSYIREPGFAGFLRKVWEKLR